MKLKPEWKYAAMDENGLWCVYNSLPLIGEGVWKGENWVRLPRYFIFPEVEDWTKSLHTITEEGELVPYVDIPADGEKVMVRGCNSGCWYKRYSTGHLDSTGYLLCYKDGANKWSSGGRSTPWKEWRRPTEEELV